MFIKILLESDKIRITSSLAKVVDPISGIVLDRPMNHL